jgi:hypothetical protein
MVAGGLVAYDEDGYKSVISGTEDPLHAVRTLEFAKVRVVGDRKRCARMFRTAVLVNPALFGKPAPSLPRCTNVCRTYPQVYRPLQGGLFATGLP